MGKGCVQSHLSLCHKSMAVFARSFSCFVCIFLQELTGEAMILQDRSPLKESIYRMDCLHKWCLDWRLYFISRCKFGPHSWKSVNEWENHECISEKKARCLDCRCDLFLQGCKLNGNWSFNPKSQTNGECADIKTDNNLISIKRLYPVCLTFIVTESHFSDWPNHKPCNQILIRVVLL